MTNKLLLSCFLLLSLMLYGCGDAKTDKQSPSSIAEKKTTTINFDVYEKSDYSADVTPFGENDIQAVGVKLGMSFAEVTKKIGEPLTYRKEDSEALGFQLFVSYPFGELTFDAIDDKLENSTVSCISINKAAYKGPRDIEIGDTLDSVLSKFPRKENPITDGYKDLYRINTGQNELIGQIAYDDQNNIEEVRYSIGSGGFGTIGLIYQITNGLVSKIRIDVINV